MQRDDFSCVDFDDCRSGIPSQRRSIVGQGIDDIFEALNSGARANNTRLQPLYVVYFAENAVLKRDIVSLVPGRIADHNDIVVEQFFRRFDW